MKQEFKPGDRIIRINDSCQDCELGYTYTYHAEHEYGISLSNVFGLYSKKNFIKELTVINLIK